MPQIYLDTFTLKKLKQISKKLQNSPDNVVSDLIMNQYFELFGYNEDKEQD